MPLALAIGLAAVLAWAGARKLVARSTTARSFRALGLPAAELLATGVPVVELALASGLILGPAVAAPATVAVLGAFSAVLARARRSGVTVGCGCFATAKRGPVSGWDLVRNAGLGLAALTVATAAGTALAAVGAGILVGGVALAVPLRIGDRTGRAAPVVPGLDYGAADTTVVAFLAPGCERCEGVRRSLAVLGPGVQVRVVELDDGAAPLFAAAGVRTPPMVLTVDRNGRITEEGVPAAAR